MSSSLEIDIQEVFEPLLEPARYLGAWGGRSSGKSHFFAGLAVARMVSSKTDIVCIREVQKTLDQSVKKLIENKIEDLGLQRHFTVKNTHIESILGGRCIFMGMQDYTAESIKSLEGYDVAFCEEAQTLSQRSLDLLRPTIRKAGSQMWFAWNPRFETDPVDALLRGESPPPGSRVVKALYLDNKFLSDEIRAEIEYDRTRDADKFSHIWLGGYQTHSDALVFKNWKIEEFEEDQGVVFRQGADWGFAQDPSVLVRCYTRGRQLFVSQEAWAIGCEIDRLPDLFRTVPDAEKWYITADSARPETISYLQRFGFPRMSSAMKGKNSVEDGVEFLKSFDIVVHPRCRRTIGEFTTYSYEVDKHTGAVLPRLKDANNHCIDALRYATEAERRAMRPAAEVKIKAPAVMPQAWMG